MRDMILKKWKTAAPYYMIQIHMEMAAQGVSETLFVVWTPLLTRMWKIPFNRSFWNLCLEVLENFRQKLKNMQSKLKKNSQLMI